MSLEQKLATLNKEQKEYMTWLYSNMPPGDAADYTFELFLSFVDHALMLRKTLPWCRELDEDKFRNDVLYYRVNNEDISNCRSIFYRALIDRIRNLNGEDRVLEINRWCNEIATYQSDDDRTISPLTVYRAGYGRCGEESNFLVSALRSVGIAARQIYVPWWSHCDDNHAWVEAWCNNSWHFLGACEPEPILDSGWFNNASSRAMLIVSRAFAFDPQEGELLGKFGPIYLYNQTFRYAPTRRYTFTVLDNGRPIERAAIGLELLNMGAYYPIITLMTNHKGEVSIEMGRGDIHLSVSYENKIATCICHGERQGKMDIELYEHKKSDSDWATFDFIAPKDSPVNPVTYDENHKKRRSEVLEYGTALREKRLRNFYDQEKVSEFYGAKSYFRLAAGNFNEIYRFLKHDKNPIRMKMLSTLSQKDFVDVQANVLEDHLSTSIAFDKSVPESIFQSYILCPRIDYEMLTAWRSQLVNLITDQEKSVWHTDPEKLWNDLCLTIHCYDNGGYFHFTISPIAAYKEKIADELSLRILFVAICRTLGIPARLDPADRTPEYWKNGHFHRVDKQEKRALVTIVRAPNVQFIYHQNWGLSRWTGDHWQAIDLSEVVWENLNLKFSLPVGYYRVLTTNRLPNGNQFAAEKRFCVSHEEQIVKITLILRDYQVSDMLEDYTLPSFDFFDKKGSDMSSDVIINDRKFKLLIWLEEGMEPTEHVLNELATYRAQVQSLPISVNFFLNDRKSFGQRTLANLLSKWDKIHAYYGNWSDNLELIARRTYCDPGRPPLLVVCGRNGRAIYAFSGYNVGIVDMIMKIIKYSDE
ncbi:MAG: transglutaminase domain-containing protein [Sporolactobacillus sp.]